MNTAREILNDHIESCSKLGILAVTHLTKEYRGAVFGWAWAVLKPAITIFVFWFAFTFGLRHGNAINGYHFFLWLISGFVPWFFMRDSMANGSSALRKYRYLVQRIKFPIDTIPTFVCLGELITNLFLFVILNVIFFLFGHAPDIYYLQLPLYFLMMFVFFDLWAICFSLLSAVSIDFMNFIRALIPVIFWLSGIIYDVNAVRHVWLRELLLLNPVTLIVNGFRNALIYNRWFWEVPGELIRYFIVTCIMAMAAVWAYRKLKVDIPDIL